MACIVFTIARHAPPACYDDAQNDAKRRALRILSYELSLLFLPPRAGKLVHLFSSARAVSPDDGLWSIPEVVGGTPPLLPVAIPDSRTMEGPVVWVPLPHDVPARWYGDEEEAWTVDSMTAFRAWVESQLAQLRATVPPHVLRPHLAHLAEESAAGRASDGAWSGFDFPPRFLAFKPRMWMVMADIMREQDGVGVGATQGVGRDDKRGGTGDDDGGDDAGGVVVIDSDGEQGSGDATGGASAGAGGGAGSGAGSGAGRVITHAPQAPTDVPTATAAEAAALSFEQQMALVLERSKTET